MMMGEFCMEDWDLQAVVRSGCSGNHAEFANIRNNSPPLFAPLSFDQDELSNFQESTTDFDGLEGLFKPLFPELNQTLYQENNDILCTSSTICSTESISVQEMVKERQKVLQRKKPVSESTNSTDVTGAAKSKTRRKNQQKRVVQQVKEDALSSDMWAWRKYGQKPIKGSPYPRSYYRCSSLKGCLARKQVERSSKDPSMFTVTYTAEHSHAQPTRRSSLAGSTRVKPSIPKEAITNTKPNNQTIKDEGSPNFDGVLSPATPSMASIEDELVQSVSCVKNEELEEQIVEENEIVMPDLVFSDDLFPSLEGFEIAEENEIVMPDLVFSDDLFPSLEDFDGLLLDPFADTFSR